MLAIAFGIYVLFVRLPKKSEMVGQIDGKVSRRADGMGGMVSLWRFVMLYCMLIHWTMQPLHGSGFMIKKVSLTGCRIFSFVLFRCT